MNAERREIVEVDSDIKELLPKLLESLWADLSELKILLEKKELVEVRRLSHKLKGRFAIIGFSHASEICSCLEAVAQSGRVDVLEATFADLVACISRLEVVDRSAVLRKAKPKILVIDDDEKILEILRIRVGAEYDFVGVTDPAFALPYALQTKPDLILCDIDMPGMNGGEVSNLLESHPGTSRIPFAYLTAFVTPSEVRVMKGNVGGRPGIAKSTTSKEMLGLLEALLRIS